MDKAITLEFTIDGKVTGASVVNRYFGAAQFDGKGAVDWGRGMGATRMAGPRAKMNFEAQYLGALPETSQVALTDGVLKFSSANGETSATFMSGEYLEGQIVCASAGDANVLSGTVVKVTLSDVSLADAPSQIISKVEIVDVVKFPVRFRIPYTKEAIKPKRMYAISARIEKGEKLLYINDTAHAVLGDGKAPAKPVNLAVIPLQPK